MRALLRIAGAVDHLSIAIGIYRFFLDNVRLGLDVSWRVSVLIGLGLRCGLPGFLGWSFVGNIVLVISGVISLAFGFGRAGSLWFLGSWRRSGGSTIPSIQGLSFALKLVESLTIRPTLSVKHITDGRLHMKELSE